MQKDEFIQYLGTHKNEYAFAVGDLDGDSGVYVSNKMFETETHFAWNAIEESELETLLQNTSHGRNVEQMTRVTGYFSKVGAWNKGKQGELKDRSRSEVR